MCTKTRPEYVVKLFFFCTQISTSAVVKVTENGSNAMKREDLREIGLEDDQIDKVLAKVHQERGADTTKNDALVAERDDLKTQLAERDADLKKLKKSAKDNEELTAELDDLKGKYAKQGEELTAKLAASTLDSAVNEALGNTTARDKSVVKKLLNYDDIKMNDDGTVTGVNEQLKALQSEQAYLFDQGTKTTGSTPMGGSTATPEIAKMSYKERVALKNENPEAYAQAMNKGE